MPLSPKKASWYSPKKLDDEKWGPGCFFQPYRPVGGAEMVDHPIIQLYKNWIRSAWIIIFHLPSGKLTLISLM